MFYYHASLDDLAPGTILEGRGTDYERDWGYVPFFQALELHRPSDKLSHTNAVFMVGCDDDLDGAGGGTEYVFTLEALGPVSKHDMNWSSRISCAIDDGHPLDSETVRELATNYWEGKPSPDEPLWEYLTPRARIISVEEY